jgi:HEPN domain-containing protein
MPDKAVLRESALEWLRFALEDLDYARTGLQSQHLSAGVACFHAQQTAEKSIKAVLVLEGADIPKIHDLIKLVALLPVVRSTGLPADVVSLTSYAVEHRYPGEGEAPSREQLAKAVQLADETLAWARTVVG